jgi:hypothetical protein
MRNTVSITVFMLFLFTGACNKDMAEQTVVTPPEPEPPKPVYVPIYEPGDTSKGAAYAKKLTADFRADAIYLYNKYTNPHSIFISFGTYTKSGEPRERISFGDLNLNTTGRYPLARPPKARQGFVRVGYGTTRADGDVAEDFYHLDTTARDNTLLITKLDLVNKRIEGTFTMSFEIEEPQFNDKNPKKVKFSEGRFWAKIPD